MIYWCPVCEMARDGSDVEVVPGTIVGDIEFCETCGGEVVPATNCRIHGTSALDEMGECAKC